LTLLKTALGEPLVGETVEITVNDPYGNKIYSTTVTTSSDGSFRFEYKVPSNATEGLYKVIATAKGVAMSADFAVIIPPTPWYVTAGPWIVAVIILIIIAVVLYVRRRG